MDTTQGQTMHILSDNRTALKYASKVSPILQMLALEIQDLCNKHHLAVLYQSRYTESNTTTNASSCSPQDSLPKDTITLKHQTQSECICVQHQQETEQILELQPGLGCKGTRCFQTKMQLKKKHNPNSSSNTAKHLKISGHSI